MVSRQKNNSNPYIKFKMWMLENEIRQADVAELIGKNTSVFNQNINGRRGDLMGREVALICKTYNISADKYFF